MNNFFVVEEMLQDLRNYLNRSEEALNADNDIQLLRCLEHIEEISKNIRTRWVMVE
jgi:hypothetical protein